VSLEIPMPKAVLNCSLTPSQGKYSFDPVKKLLRWEVGKIDVTKLPNIRGSVSIAEFFSYTLHSKNDFIYILTGLFL